MPGLHRMKPTFFPAPADFRAWLEANHGRVDELLVGFYKKDSGRPSLTWPESVDEALCFGWIDGVRRRHAADSYTIRFTPRRKGSVWSAINIRRVAVLKKAGRMRAAGLAAFSRRRENKSGIYAYEQRYTAKLPPDLVKRFRAVPEAWTFFNAQPPGYKQKLTYWIASAKQDATRRSRLEKLIVYASRGKRYE